MHTVHVDDLAVAAIALAKWIEKEGRKQADALAGEEIPPNDKSKVKVAEAQNLPEHGKKIIAPVFNLVSSTPHYLCLCESRR